MNLLFFNKSHCDERSEEAISFKNVRLPRLDISSLVMTKKSTHRHSRENGNPFVVFAITFIVFSILFYFPSFAEDKEPILVGDISSYTAGSIIAEPTRNGFEIASEQINDDGGILGRQIQVISVDDMGSPSDALKVAERLVNRDNVKILTGCSLANIELALSDFAKRNKILYISSCTNSDKFFQENFSRYSFRGAGASVHTVNNILAREAAKQGKKRWVSVNHNYDWGHSNFEAFKESLSKYDPEAEWIEVQWPAVGKIDAGAVVQALKKAKPDAIYTSLWGSDLYQLLREGKKRGLFTDDMLKVSQDLGRAENLITLGDNLPEGWITVGLNASKIDNPMMNYFVEQYKEKYGTDKMGWTGVMAYQTLFTLKAAIEKAGNTENENIIDALEKYFSVKSVYGVPLQIRGSDHMPSHGIWIGKTAVINDEAVFTDTRYVDGTGYLPRNK